MLTRKQIWRKLKLRSSSIDCHDGETIDGDDCSHTSKSIMDSVHSSSSLESFHSSESIRNSVHSNYDCEKCSKQLSVKFKNVVTVCLVPCRDELRPLYSDIYWSGDEVQLFKDEAYSELKYYSELNECTIKQSIYQLYGCENLNTSR